MINRLLCIAAYFILIVSAHAQKKSDHLIYIDKSGVMRYTGSDKEASFFGVNYTVPFAHGYRMHKKLGIDHKKAIDADVYHMHRLGLNAFRVHVWDTEISDSAGNLLTNDHLDLYDYLLYRLESYGIKTVLTPLAYWGNGYPEPDEKTGSFASIINNKQKVLTEEWAIKAQENYLKQLLQHTNPYTKKKYGEDRDIIALEINNEPHHTGSKEKVREYISRMIKAVRSTGWSKPIFYNISESPVYADVVANSDIQGVTFQWYPTGLVANRSLKGNYLPHVDHYRIPFRDTIPAFKNKALMVYEFDAGDVAGSYMYPAMARSFRTAGFQWATQFAYDPLYTAHFNTEYQTHYLNLLYTPSKAISLLIASKVFQKLPRYKSYSIHPENKIGSFPQDTLFDVFRVSYKQDLSEMNDDTAFYYSNSTTTIPRDLSKLKHVAGVGSSPLVQYEGTGAYFLTKIKDGYWHLEVMPGVASIGDPFGKASPNRVIGELDSSIRSFTVSLPDLGKAFSILPGESRVAHQGKFTSLYKKTKATNGSIELAPGFYQLSASSVKISAFYNFRYPAGLAKVSSVTLNHNSHQEVTAGIPLWIKATIIGTDTTDWINLEVRNSMNQWKTISAKVVNGKFEAIIPADMITPGIINYRMILRRKNGDVYVFPGAHKGDPYAWDNQHINESWSSYVMPVGSPLRIFDPVRDKEKLMVYNPDWRNNLIGYSVASNRKHLVQWLKMSKDAPEQILAWQQYVGDLLKARSSEVDSFTKVAIRGRSITPGKTTIRLALIDDQGSTFQSQLTFDEKTTDLVIPLTAFDPGGSLLLPAAYPRFMPKDFGNTFGRNLKLKDIEKIEVRVQNVRWGTDQGAEIEFIQLIK